MKEELQNNLKLQLAEKNYELHATHTEKLLFYGFAEMKYQFKKLSFLIHIL